MEYAHAVIERGAHWCLVKLTFPGADTLEMDLTPEMPSSDEAALLMAAARYVDSQMDEAWHDADIATADDLWARAVAANEACERLASVLRPAGRREIVVVGCTNGRRLSYSIRPVFAVVDGRPTVGFSGFARAWDDEPWQRSGDSVAPSYILALLELGRVLYARTRSVSLHEHFSGRCEDPDTEAAFNQKDSLQQQQPEVTAMTQVFRSAANYERERYYDAVAAVGEAMSQPSADVRVYGKLSLTPVAGGRIQITLVNGQERRHVARLFSPRDANVILAAAGKRAKAEGGFTEFVDYVVRLDRQLHEKAFPLTDEKRQVLVLG